MTQAAVSASRPRPYQASKKDLTRAIFSGWAGTSLEYFDFQLYGLASALVFSRLFFPELDPAMGLLSSFATYSIGFLARPLGALFFGRLGDRRGRKYVLVVTVTLMGLATCGIGLLPTYGTIGIWAPILLIVLRMTQGFGAGAELAGASVLLAEYAPSKSRGLVSSFACIGTNTGTLLASGTWLLLIALPEDQLLSWGWRIPFLASILLAVVALIIRSKLSETPVFQTVASNDTVAVENRTPIKDAFTQGRRPFFLALGMRMGESGPSSIYQSFLLGYIATVLLMDKSVGTRALFIASLIGFVTVPLAGWLSDRFGRRIVYRVVSGFQTAFAVPALLLLNTRDPVIVSAVLIVGVCVGVLGLYSVQSSYLPELFGSRYRYSGLAAAKEFGSIVSGGMAPLVGAALLAAFSSSWIPIAIYLTLLAGIGFVTTFFAPETVGRDLTLTEHAG